MSYSDISRYLSNSTAAGGNVIDYQFLKDMQFYKSMTLKNDTVSPIDNFYEFKCI